MRLDRAAGPIAQQLEDSSPAAAGPSKAGSNLGQPLAGLPSQDDEWRYRRAFGPDATKHRAASAQLGRY